jgi:hypothetical protein
MDDTLARRFFLEPSCPQQRQYDALRAVFVEGLSQKDAALRWHYSPGAFRALVHQFRVACAAGTPPPFFRRRAEDGRLPTQPEASHRHRTNRRPPTPGR